MRQYSRRAVVVASLQDDPDLTPLSEILEPPSISVDRPLPRLTAAEEGSFFKNTGAILAPADFAALLTYLGNTGRPHRSFDAPMPYSETDIYLSALVKLEH